MIRVGAVLLLLSFQAPEAVDDLKAAIETTAASPYAYRVGGRFKREGVFAPPDVLTARIDGYQSARNGAKILVKGPEGLWKTPDERIGEQVEGTPADVADKVTTLREAERPHEMLATLLAEVKAGKGRADGGVFTLAFDPEKVRTYMRKELDKAVERRTIPRPDSVSWDTAEGKLVVHVDKAGRIAKFRDERSVSIRYRRAGEPDEKKRYKTEMEFELFDHGVASINLPAEVKERLGIK
jgi:hypothetical protein